MSVSFFVLPFFVPKPHKANVDTGNLPVSVSVKVLARSNGLRPSRPSQYLKTFCANISSIQDPVSLAARAHPKHVFKEDQSALTSKIRQEVSALLVKVEVGAERQTERDTSHNPKRRGGPSGGRLVPGTSSGPKCDPSAVRALRVVCTGPNFSTTPTAVFSACPSGLCVGGESLLGPLWRMMCG